MGATDTREWAFTIPLLPPSVNSLHNVIYSQRRVELKPEIRKWRNDIASFIPSIRLQPDTFIEVNVTFYHKFNYANGKLRRFDVHNTIKSLLDVISAKANFDDCRVKFGSWASIEGDDKVEVRLRELPRDGHSS